MFSLFYLKVKYNWERERERGREDVDFSCLEVRRLREDLRYEREGGRERERKREGKKVFRRKKT